MAEPPDVAPHGDVAVPVGTHVVLVEAVVGEEGADGDVVGGVEAHVDDPGHDAVIGPHGAGHRREGAEENGKVALVGVVDGWVAVLRADTRKDEISKGWPLPAQLPKSPCFNRKRSTSTYRLVL